MECKTDVLPITSGTAEKNPYLKRQDAMYEFIDVALHKNYGLYPMVSVTGSGKNYVAGVRWCADVLHAGADARGNFARLPGRNAIVVVIPQKENCKSFAASIRSRLVELGHAPEEADDMALWVPSNREGLGKWFDDERLATGGIGEWPCPLTCADDEEWNAKIAGTWRHARDTHRKEGAYRDPAVSAPLKREFERLERDLRRKVRDRVRDRVRERELAAALDDGDSLRRLWPASRLATARPRVLVMTPQKWISRVDTVVGGRISFAGATAAEKRVYIIDEFDQLKRAVLEKSVEDAIRYQPDDVVRFMHDRLREETSELGGLIKADPKAWKAEFGKAMSDRYAGSAVLRGVYTMRDLDRDISRLDWSFKKVSDVVESVYGDLRLSKSFKTDGGLLGDRLIFGEDNLSVGGGRGECASLIVDLTAESANIIKKGGGQANPDDPATAPLPRVLSRLVGACDIVRRHLALCVRVRDGIFMGAVGAEMGWSAGAVIDALGIHGSASGDAEAWKELVAPASSAGFAAAASGSKDDSVYMRGVGFIELEDGEDHPETTRIYRAAVDSLPCAMLSHVLAKAPCVAMSATCEAPTVRNFGFDYLRDVRAVMPNDPQVRALGEEILSLTETVNDADARRYDVAVGAVGPEEDLSRLISFYFSCEQRARAEEIARLAKDAARKICPSEAFVEELACGEGVRELIKECKENAKEGENVCNSVCYSLQRVIKAVKAVAAWASGVTTGRHYAALILQPFNMRSAEKPAAKALLRTLSALIVEHESASGNGYWDHRMDAQEAHGAFMELDAGGWDVGWKELCRRLTERGRPMCLFSAYGTAGFSKNLQFAVPKKLADAVKRVDHDLPADGGACEMDFDFVYLAEPTNSLTRGDGSNSDERDPSIGWTAKKLLAIAEREELYEARGELDHKQKCRDIRKVLHGSKYLEMKGLRSAKVEGARAIVQGVGRVSRTTCKMPEVAIVIDEAALESCDFSWLRGLPVGYEMRELLSLCDSKAEDVGPLLPDAMAAVRTRRYKNTHERRLRALMSDHAREGDLEAFDVERRGALARFNCDPETAGVGADRRANLLRSPEPCVGYAYAEGDADGGSVVLEWARSGEATLAPARVRLARRIAFANAEGQWPHIREVSCEDARLAEVTVVPEVAERFAEKGYQSGPTVAKLHMTPYEYRTVYLGSLGEEAGEAILSARLGDRWSLERGDARRAERAGDYEVVAADGSRTGVWVDFKHFKVGPYSAYKAWGDEGLSEGERYRQKAEKVGAEKILVINLVADDAARGMAPKAVGPSAVSFPYLIDDGKVDERMVGAIRNAIERYARA